MTGGVRDLSPVKAAVRKLDYIVSREGWGENNFRAKRAYLDILIAEQKSQNGLASFTRDNHARIKESRAELADPGGR